MISEKGAFAGGKLTVNVLNDRWYSTAKSITEEVEGLRENDTSISNVSSFLHILFLPSLFSSQSDSSFHRETMFLLEVRFRIDFATTSTYKYYISKSYLYAFDIGKWNVFNDCVHMRQKDD